MLDLTSIPGTDDWWLMRLCDELGNGLPRMKKLTGYRDGDALLPDPGGDIGTRATYMRFMRRARLHVVETIRDARTDRQHVVGFRTGAGGDENGDEAAWAHWVRNRMPMQIRPFFNDTADYGRSYIVTMPSTDGPVWSIRNEWNTITMQNSVRPWLADAGITIGFDINLQAEVATLFRPGYMRQAIRRTLVPTLPQDGTPWYGTPDWTWMGEPIRTPYTPDALIHQNKTPDGFGIWEKHLDTVDRINEITLNALTIIVMQSFRQRAIETTGALPSHYPEGHPNAGQPIDYDELFHGGPAALWLLPTGSKIWESNPVDVTPVYNARKDELKTLSSLTRTPQDIFDNSSQNQSALGAEISREPLIFAVRGMNEQAGVALASAQAQSFRMDGDTVRGDVTKIETLFGKIQPATLAEKAEAAAKMQARVSQRWFDTEVLEMTPRERAQAEDDRAQESFLAALDAASLSSSTGAGVTSGGE